MERRRFLGMAASAGVVGGAALSTAGCGTATGQGSGSALTMIAADYGDRGSNNGSQGYWDALVRDFQRKHGIAVDVSVHSWKDVDKKVAGLVEAGRAPDIAQIGAFADYAAQDRLYSVGELLSIPVQADFLPGLAEAGAVKRVLYGMPFVASTRLLFYNKTLFAGAGLDPGSPPRTWKELVRAAAALKRAGVRIPYGLPLGPEEAPAEAFMWMLSGGGGFTDKTGNYTIDATENIRTFNWLRDNLVSEKLTNYRPGGTDRQDLFNAFGRGEVGMLNGHPTLMRQAARRGVEYGTAVPPGANAPSDGTLGVADWMMGFKRNGNREQIGRFLDFVYSERNHYTFADRYDLLPVTTAASERMREGREHKKLWRFLDQLTSAEFYPVGKVSWARVSAEMKKSIGQVVAEDADPAAVLTGIQRKAEAAEAAAGGR
ncbi:MAG: ABC transporter substrate-binding protein [Streptomyces sp.]|uniref:ABC transporter substrate-binding protein n=1 Tax=Streptomyces sp. TaxID=1931 RepID=UPI003D6C1232